MRNLPPMKFWKLEAKSANKATLTAHNKNISIPNAPYNCSYRIN